MTLRPLGFYFYQVLLVAMALGVASPALARTMENDPAGFYGIKWGSDVTDLPGLVKVDTDRNVETYMVQSPSPAIEGIPVDSIKLTTINGKLAQVAIRYHGDSTHQSLLKYLESKYGDIELPPGSMMRGLSQHYSWRGTETVISVTYREFRQQGYVFVESRILAPRFLDSISEHSF
ncbi:MAG: hypothetical protein D6690_16755 [Nitrospirae bacterium]|nr:MAG: hypothetical protein D6690_16755 [Nitrospirota bacterium]